MPLFVLKSSMDFSSLPHSMSLHTSHSLAFTCLTVASCLTRHRCWCRRSLFCSPGYVELQWSISALSILLSHFKSQPKSSFLLYLLITLTLSYTVKTLPVISINDNQRLCSLLDQMCLGLSCIGSPCSCEREGEGPKKPLNMV